MDQRTTPRKPWYRLRNIVLLIIAVFVALGVREVYWALTATPGASVDYGQKLVELAQAIKPGYSEDEDAAPLIAKAMEIRDKARDEVWQAHPEVDQIRPIVDFTLLYTKFDPANPGATGNAYGDEADFNRRRDITLEVLEKCRERGLYDLLAQIAAKPVMIRPKHAGELLGLLLPDLGAIRDMARANASRMRLARQAKNAKEFTDAFEQSMGLARVCTADPIIISNLVGVAVAALAMGEVRDAIAAGDATPEMLRGAAAALERQNLHDITHALGGERLFLLDMIQRTHTDDGHGDGRRIVSESNRLHEWGTGQASRSTTRIANLASAFYPSKKQITAVAEDLYSKLNEYAAMSVEERRLPKWTPTGAAAQLPWNYDVLKMMFPALERAVTTRDMDRAERAGLRMLLAIELYRVDKGRPPSTLDELVPAYLDKLPRDPYAADGKFRLLLLDAPDAEGRTYLLYSVGQDGADNGGVDPSSISTSRQAVKAIEGTDLIINKRK